MLTCTEVTATVTVKPVLAWMAFAIVLPRAADDKVVVSVAEFSAVAVTAVPTSIPAARRVVSVTDVTDTLLGATPKKPAMAAT